MKETTKRMLRGLLCSIIGHEWHDWGLLDLSSVWRCEYCRKKSRSYDWEHNYSIVKVKGVDTKRKSCGLCKYRKQGVEITKDTDKSNFETHYARVLEKDL